MLGVQGPCGGLLVEHPEPSGHRPTELGGSGAVGWVVGVDDLVAGVGFDDDIAPVVDVVVTHGAGETHLVDVG